MQKHYGQIYKTVLKYTKENLNNQELYHDYELKESMS